MLAVRRKHLPAWTHAHINTRGEIDMHKIRCMCCIQAVQSIYKRSAAQYTRSAERKIYTGSQSGWQDQHDKRVLCRVQQLISKRPHFNECENVHACHEVGETIVRQDSWALQRATVRSIYSCSGAMSTKTKTHVMRSARPTRALAWYWHGTCQCTFGVRHLECLQH